MSAGKILVAVVLSCACAFGLSGCGCASSDNALSGSDDSGNSAVFGNAQNTSEEDDAASSGGSDTDASDSQSSTDEAEVAGTANDALQLVADDGISSLTSKEFQALMDDGRLDIGMTLSEVRTLMGTDGVKMDETAYSANTYAFYSSDKQKAIICTFDGSDGASKAVEFEISLD